MVIGVDLGGMSAKAAILQNGKLIGKSRVETSAENAATETAFALAKLCKQTAEKEGIPFENISTIGIGSPGVIDSRAGTVVSWTNYGWKDVPLAAMIQKYTGKPTYVSNDANVAALGEAKYGAGRNYSSSLMVTIGTGVGGGIVLNGKLYEGFRSAGAEIGHMVIRQNGDLCTCGRRGCYEVYASARALVRITQETMQTERKSAMWKYAKTIEDVDGRTVFLAAREGDAAAEIALAKYISSLGEGIVDLVNIFRPQAVILGGGISAEKEALLDPLKDYVYPRIYVSKEYAPLEIVCAELGNDAGIYGAAQYALEKL
ncbi:MAG: ROK family protein [Clostridia bacterium]|nr:ROK family protein [Clostridia bacterium]